MSCGSCGSGGAANGKPSGCQSNGGCSSGGCNRLNVFNWLADLPLSDVGKPYPIVEISFNNGSRKDFFKNDTNQYLEKGMMLAVESSNGFDVGQVSLTGELVKLQMKKHNVKESDELKQILRIANEHDIAMHQAAKEKEKSILIKSRAIAKTLNLEMKIAEAELQADGKKVCFFYTADARVDFRELIKLYASEFKTKIEMRQIGARQESSKVGGIGSCGRELCCSSWLTDFKTVNTTNARYQNLSINQAKLSGQCGRLKCCLNYELDTYMDALKVFPEHVDHLEIATGRAFLIKKDIFRNLIWYGMPGSSRQYPLTLERVEEIIALNKKGIKPEELEFVEVVQTKNKNAVKTIDIGFVNDVGQITLSALSKGNKKKKSNAPKSQSETVTTKPNRSQPKPQSGQEPKAKDHQQSAKQGRETQTHAPKPKHAGHPKGHPNKGEGQGQPNTNKAQNAPVAPKNATHQQPKSEGSGNRKPKPHHGKPKFRPPQTPNQTPPPAGG